MATHQYFSSTNTSATSTTMAAYYYFAFVTDADAAVAAQVDQTPWENRRAIMKGIAGF